MRSLAASGQTQRLLEYLTGGSEMLAPRHFQRIGHDLALTPDAPEPNMKLRIQRSLSLLPHEAVEALKALTVFDPKPNSFRERDALAVAACNRNTFYGLVDTGLIEPLHGRYTIHRSIWQVARLEAVSSESQIRLAAHYSKALSSDEKLAFSPADARNIRRALEAGQRCELADAFAQIANGAFLIFEHPSEHSFVEEALLQIKDVAGAEALSAPILARLGRLRAAKGQTTEARELCELAICKAEAANDSDASVLAMQTLADIEMDAGAESQSDVVEQAMNARKSVRDEQTMMRVGSEVIKSRLLKGQLTQVRNFLLRTAPDEFEERSSAAANLALAYTAKGWFEWLNGDVPQAQARLTRMLARTRERNYRMPYLFSVGALAWLMLHRGEYERAVSLANELLAAGDRDVVPDFVACAFNVLGQVASDRGDDGTALQWLDKGIGYATLHGIQPMLAGLNVTKARVHLSTGAWPHAQSTATVALHISRDNDSRPMACCASTMLGVIAYERGERDQAVECFNAAAGYIKSQGANDPWTQLFYQRRNSAFQLQSAQPAPAITQMKEALHLAQRLNALDDQAECLFLLAQAYLTLENHEQARASAYESLNLHRRLGHRCFVRTGNWITLNHLDSDRL
jgi:tetratricopeptide (TPR) repeat protein